MLLPGGIQLPAEPSLGWEGLDPEPAAQGAAKTFVWWDMIHSSLSPGTAGTSPRPCNLMESQNLGWKGPCSNPLPWDLCCPGQGGVGSSAHPSS